MESKPLFGPISANVRVRETPEHREIILLRVAGLRQKAIAKRVGMTEATVSTILNQPWAKEYMAELIDKTVGKDIDKHLKEVASEALVVARDIMRESESEKLRATCAFKFMDLHKGQKLTIEDNRRDLGDIEREIAETAKELEAMEKGKNAPPA
jgi:predicted transcriptional regulator